MKTVFVGKTEKMKYFQIAIAEEYYEVIKKYARARRKYEIGNGYRVENVIADILEVGLDGIRNAEFTDASGAVVDWMSE